MIGEIIVSPSFIGLRDDCAERRENVGGEIMFCSNRWDRCSTWMPSCTRLIIWIYRSGVPFQLCSWVVIIIIDEKLSPPPPLSLSLSNSQRYTLIFLTCILIVRRFSYISRRKGRRRRRKIRSLKNFFPVFFFFFLLRSVVNRLSADADWRRIGGIANVNKIHKDFTIPLSICNFVSRAIGPSPTN